MRISPLPLRSGWGKRIQYGLRGIYLAVKESNLLPFRICVLEVVTNISNVFCRGCDHVITETQGNLLWVSHYSFTFIQKDNSFLAPRQKPDFFPGVLACLLNWFSHVWLCNPDCSPPGSSVHWDPPGKNTGVVCHALLQGTSQPRDLLCLLHCRQILYHKCHMGSPLECLGNKNSCGNFKPKILFLFHDYQ